MRIGNNIIALRIILASFLFAMGGAVSVYAADPPVTSPPAPATPPAAVPASTATGTNPSASPSTPAAAPSAASGSAAPTPVAATTTSPSSTATPTPPPVHEDASASSASSIVLPQPPSPPDLATSGNNQNPKASGNGLANAENKISDSVKDVLKKLDKPTEDVTLDDLNTARQAVARIDILIEVEKHLAELDKIRHDRQKESGNAAIPNMIPASALQPPSPPAYQPPPQPVYQQPQVQPVVQQMPIQTMPREAKEPLDVTQISGEGGHYTAVIKMTGDESKTVHVGDKLGDGSAVIDISSTEVVLERNDTKRTFVNKIVETVFGNSF